MSVIHRKPGRIVVLGAIVGSTVALLATSAVGGLTTTANLKEEHKGSTNPGFETGSCPVNPNGTGDWGWHFILPGNDTDFVSVSAQFQNAGTVTDFVSDPTPKHAYVFTPGPDTLLDASAQVSGPQTEFILSHVCTGTTDGGGGDGGGDGAPVEVGGVTAERPPAATAVTGQPRFTG
jgi:hypothetical protein